MKGLLGRKIGMTRLFREDGRCVPVTVLEVGPVVAVQVKTLKKDGYDAVQVGYQPFAKPKQANKPTKGHFKELTPMKHLKEFTVADVSQVRPGQQWDVRAFSEGEKVRISGISKGKGFQGVIKRHGFSGGPASHGSQFHRTPGSIGCHTDPGRVFKGKSMPGHMGHERVSVHNLRVEQVSPEKNLLLLRGAVPGPNGGLVEVSKYTLNVPSSAPEENKAPVAQPSPVSSGTEQKVEPTAIDPKSAATPPAATSSATPDATPEKS